MKKILIVLMPFDHGLSGISVYIREMIKNLIEELGDKVQIDCMILEQDLPYLLHKKKNVRYLIYSNFFSGPIINMLFHLFYFPLRLFLMKIFTEKNNHYDAVLLPAANRRVFSFYPFYTVGVIHDLSPLRMAGKYDFLRTFYVKWVIPFFLKKADKIVAVSRSTLSDIVHLTNISEKKLGVNYPGCTTSLFPALKITKNQAKKLVKNHWGIEKDFFLFVSRIEYPGKNHVGLLRAYQALSKKIQDKYDLIFVGNPWTNSEHVRDYACNMKECRNIHFLGFVTTEELSYLYRASSLFVFPSFYEGFGFPVLEAMAHGVPVLISDRSSLLELGYNSAVLFDPSHPEQIAHEISKILSNAAKQKKLIAKGYKRVKEFSWSVSAKKMLKYMNKEKVEWQRTPDWEKSLKNTLCLERRDLLGISFINASTNKVLEIFSYGFSVKERVKFSFINANSVNIAQKSIAFKSSLMQTHYLLPDGLGMRVACLFSGFAMKENLNGTDLFPHLIDFFEKKKKSIYFMGSKPGVLEKMIDFLKKKYPQLRIAGHHHGYFHKEKENQEMINMVNKANPDILMIGFGSPIQELWVEKNFSSLQAKVVMTVGGLFDFYSQEKARAPKWMRNIGMEWFYRMSLEPKRLWRRYLIGNVVFLMRVFSKVFVLHNVNKKKLEEDKWIES